MREKLERACHQPEDMYGVVILYKTEHSSVLCALCCSMVRVSTEGARVVGVSHGMIMAGSACIVYEADWFVHFQYESVIFPGDNDQLVFVIQI